MTLIACAVGLCIVAVISTLLLSKTRHAWLLTPFGLFSTVFAFVYFAVPAAQDLFDSRSWVATKTGFSKEVIPTAIGLAILYYVAAVAGFFSGRPRKENVATLKAAATHVGNEERGLVVALTIIQLVCAVSVLWLFYPYLESSYGKFMINRIAFSSGKGYLLAPIIVGHAAALVLTAPFLVHGRPRWRLIVGLCLVTLTAIMSGILGNRLNALVGYVYLAISTGV